MMRVPVARVKFKGDSMYRSIDEALRHAYKLWGFPMSLSVDSY